MAELDQDLERKNRDKYGDKKNDVISSSYRVSKKAGDIYCGFNAIKYITRYVGNGYKADNPIDLEKAIDYLLRMREQIPADAPKEEIKD